MLVTFSLKLFAYGFQLFGSFCNRLLKSILRLLPLGKLSLELFSGGLSCCLCGQLGLFHPLGGIFAPDTLSLQLLVGNFELSASGSKLRLYLVKRGFGFHSGLFQSFFSLLLLFACGLELFVGIRQLLGPFCNCLFQSTLRQLLLGKLRMHLFKGCFGLNSRLFQYLFSLFLLLTFGLQLFVDFRQLLSTFCNGLRKSALYLPALGSGRFQPEFHLASLVTFTIKARPQLFNDSFSGESRLLQALFGSFVIGKFFMQMFNGRFGVQPGPLQSLLGGLALGKFSLQLLRDRL